MNENYQDDRPPVTFETVREIALSLPEVEEGITHGSPSFRVRGKFLAVLKEDGETLVLKMDQFDIDMLIALEPDVYFITDHYVGWEMVLIRLPQIHPDDLRQHFEQAWRKRAPKRLIAAYDKASPSK
jgi:hypothetical protein